VLKVLEKKYDFSNLELVPADVSSMTWELIEIIKNISKK
jgi:hypothetical protein